MRKMVLFSTAAVVVLLLLSIVTYANSFSETKDVIIEANEKEGPKITVEIYTEPMDPVTIDSDPMEDIAEQGALLNMGWEAEDRYLLAKIAMAESEGESTEGKALVILVVLNRVWSDNFPNSIEEVIYQDKQFSPVANGRFDSVEPDQDCWDALLMVEQGWDESQGALYFESESSSTWHREHLQFLFQHGDHMFYTDKE